MGRVAGPELAAEVSRAGGLGILAGLNLSPDQMRAQIRRIRDLTDAPFGVNLWLHPDVRTPVDPSRLPSGEVEAANAALTAARRSLGVPETTVIPPPRADDLGAKIAIVLDERVPVWSIGLGVPDCGADVIVAQGAEAGGHRSTWRDEDASGVGTFALVPEVVDAVGVPVLAAGGIADGRGLVAALALGAAGALLGTRFVATRESMASDAWKQAILRATSDQTTLTRAFTGLPARVLRNRFVSDFDAAGGPVLPAAP